MTSNPQYAKTECVAYSPDGQANGKLITSPDICHWVGFDPHGSCSLRRIEAELLPPRAFVTVAVKLAMMSAA